MDQYSWGTKARISSSRSTTRRVATDWTRPADRPRRIFFHSKGGELITHDAVQDAPGLLGVHQILVDGPGGGDGLFTTGLGDLVKGDPVGLVVGNAQQLLQVPREMASPSRSGSVAR